MEFEDIRRQVMNYKQNLIMYSTINISSTIGVVYIFSILAYSSHPDLTNTVCRKAGVKSGNVVLNKFANNETMVELNENVRVGLNCYDLHRKHYYLHIYMKIPGLIAKYFILF